MLYAYVCVQMANWRSKVGYITSTYIAMHLTLVPLKGLQPFKYDPVQ